MPTLYAVIALVAILFLWIIRTQRRLVAIEELVRSALSQTGVQLSLRWDALKSLIELTKSYD